MSQNVKLASDHCRTRQRHHLFLLGYYTQIISQQAVSDSSEQQWDKLMLTRMLLSSTVSLKQFRLLYVNVEVQIKHLKL